MNLRQDGDLLLNTNNEPIKKTTYPSSEIKSRNVSTTTDHLALKNKIAAKQQASRAKAEEARHQLEKAIDKQYALIENKLL